ncbi:unnamed protein product [Calypogeia fissa]
MATQPGPLYEWPWSRLGNFKYLLYVPFVVKATHANVFGGYDRDNWCLHMLLLTVLRYLHGQMWMSLSRMHHVIEKYQVQQKPINFEQVDREKTWEDYLIFHAILATAVHAYLPGFNNFPLWDSKGIVFVLLLHAGPTEFAYYWLHRALHHHYLFTRYHSHHHASFVTEPVSGTVHPFLEHVSYSAVFAVPQVGAWALGGGSIGMIYFYSLGFDFMNAVGHCNWEFFPPWVFSIFPPLKYLVYTPTYHSLHHSQVHTNFALFMPLYDYLGGTVDKNSDSLYQTVRKDRTDKIFGKAFTVDKYKLDKLSMQTWVMPRLGFQYFLKFEKPRINKLIEEAILRADAKGAQVIVLGALNKNEDLNGGGVLFVKKCPNLRIRVVHGNTLTTAVILDKLPRDVSEIFLTGATSKLGRAIALYLCRRQVRVLMLTSSKERFETILNEAPAEFQRFLVQVTKYQDGKDCKTWVMGKWAFAKDQKWAPAGTHFHQFVVPPISELRKDCTYGELAGMRLPKAVKGLRSCENTMPRGCVHACHAGGLVHALEGWKHHEVGAINVDQIDITWKVALKDGFLPM